METTNEPSFVKMAPNEYKNIWKKLTETQQKILISQAGNRILETSEQVKNFWISRNFDKLIKTRHAVIQESFEQKVADPLYEICQKLK